MHKKTCFLFTLLFSFGLFLSIGQVLAADHNGNGANLDLPSIPLSVAPNAQFSPGDTSLCQGSTFTFTNTTSGTVTSWEWFLDTTLISTDSLLTHTFTDPGPHWVTLVASNGNCNDRDSALITILEAPVTHLGNDTAICFGGMVSFDAGPGFVSYLWHDNSSAQIYDGMQSGWVHVTVTDSAGCTGIDSAWVTVNPNPLLDIGNDTTFCQGGSATFAIGSGFPVITWQDNSSGQTFTATQSGLVLVLATDTNGCTGSDGALVTVIPNPTPQLGNDTTLCEGNLLTLDAGGGFASYVWQDSSGNSIYSTDTAGTYYVTVIDSNGCIGSDTITTLLNANPIVSLGNDTSACVGGSFLFNPGPQYIGYFWQDSSTAQTFTATQTGLISVTVQDQNGCFGSDSAFFTVNPPPTPFIGNDLSFCVGDSVIFDPGPGYTAYFWQDNSMNQTFTATQAALISVTVVDSNGCSGSDSALALAYPIPTLSLGNDTTICDGNSLVLDPGSGYSGYLWQDSSTTSTYAANATGSYFVTVTDSNGCRGADTLNLSTHPLPVVNLGPDQAYCQGEGTPLDAGSSPGWTYLWCNGDTTQTSTPTIGGLHCVTVTDANGCQGNDSVSITIHPLPSVSFLFTTSLLTADFTTNLSGVVLYEWGFGDGNVGTGPNPSHTYSVDGSYEVCLVVTDSNGCKNTFCDSVTVLEVSIPEPVQNAGIKAWPNPVQADANDVFFFVEMPAGLQGSGFIRNPIGQQVQEMELGSGVNELNLHGLGAGTYIFEVQTESGRAFFRILVER